MNRGGSGIRVGALGSALGLAAAGALLAAAPTAQAGGATAPARPAASLCAPGEAVQFSCPMGRGRTLSVCGQPPAALQYRVGKPRQIELRYPADAGPGAPLFFFAF